MGANNYATKKEKDRPACVLQPQSSSAMCMTGNIPEESIRRMSISYTRAKVCYTRVSTGFTGANVSSEEFAWDEWLSFASSYCCCKDY